MGAGKLSLDPDLRRLLSPEEWDEYVRLTRVGNGPSVSELPLMRRTLVVGFSLSGATLIATGIAMALSTDGGASAIPWLASTVVALFLTLVVAAVFAFREERPVRSRAVSLREELIREGYARRPDEDDRERGTPHYPVTGDYNPRQYMARGGLAMARYLEKAGYGDWETYDANKPD